MPLTFYDHSEDSVQFFGILLLWLLSLKHFSIICKNNLSNSALKLLPKHRLTKKNRIKLIHWYVANMDELKTKNRDLKSVPEREK